MSRFASDYQVARPTGVCAETGAALEPGAVCIATLCEREDDEGFDRLDYSLEAWQRGARPERLFSNWRTTVPHHEERRNPLVDDEVLMDLFMRLADDERPQRMAFRFVLGLILMRKRLLRFQGRQVEQLETATITEPETDAAPPPAKKRSGAKPKRSKTVHDNTSREIWLMKPRGDDPDLPPIPLINPHLHDEDVIELTEQLSEILQGEL